MKRTEPQLIGDIIKVAMRENNIEAAVNEQRVAYLWPEIVGQGVNRYTTRRFVAGGVLHVYLSSAALKNELQYHRQKIVDSLNNAVGSNVITDIMFH